MLNCRYRSIQAQVSFFQHSTIAALYKKGPGVCRGARPCAPLRFSHISMWISPLRGAAAYAVIRPEFRNPCGIYGRDSAIHAGIRPGPPQPMRLLFPHTKFRKYLINKVFPKLFSQNPSQTFVCICQVYGIKILRHSAFYAIFYQRKTFLCF